MIITDKDINKIIKHQTINKLWYDVQLLTKQINKYVYYHEFISSFKSIKNWQKIKSITTILTQSHYVIKFNIDDKIRVLQIIIHNDSDYHEQLVTQIKLNLKLI